MTQELEWQTRKERIDKKLKSMNPPWDIIDYNPNIDIKTLKSTAIREYATASGPADYVFIVNGKLIGVLEAKKVSINPQEVLASFTSLYITFRLYFGINTMWYVQFHFVCVKLELSIWMLSSSFMTLACETFVIISEEDFYIILISTPF